MQLGVDGVFVGSGIFKSGNPEKRAKAMVEAVTHYGDPKVLAEVSEDLGDPMVSINTSVFSIAVSNVCLYCRLVSTVSTYQRSGLIGRAPTSDYLSCLDYCVSSTVAYL